VGLHPVDPVSVLMVAVETQFVRNVQDQEKGACNAQGHPQDIQETVSEFVRDIPESAFDQAFKHDGRFCW
jgi:hypothetical protein